MRKPISEYQTPGRAKRAAVEYGKRMACYLPQLPGVIQYWAKRGWPPAQRFAQTAAFTGGPPTPTVIELAALVAERQPSLTEFINRALMGWHHNSKLKEHLPLEKALRLAPAAVLHADTSLLKDGRGRRDPKDQGIMPWLLIAYWWRQQPGADTEHAF